MTAIDILQQSHFQFVLNPVSLHPILILSISAIALGSICTSSSQVQTITHSFQKNLDQREYKEAVEA